MLRRSLILNLLKYALAFGLLGFIIWKNWEPASGNGLKHVWTEHVVEGKPVEYGYLGLAFLLFTFSYFITFIRWYFLVRAQDLPFHIKDALRLGLYGVFFSTFLPGSVGGDAVKALGIARGQKRRMVAVATVIMDRLIAVWAMIMMVAILGGLFQAMGMELTTAAKRIVRVSAIVVGASVVIWLLLGILPQRRADKFAGRLSRIPKAGHSLAELWRAVWMYRCQQKTVYFALGLTWLGQLGFVFGFYFGVLTLHDAGLVPSAAKHFLLVPIGLIIQAAPLFPGGAGIGEAGFGGLYIWFGSTMTIGVLGSLMMRAITWVFAVAGFLVAQRLHPVESEEKELPPASVPHLKPKCEASPAG